MSIACSSCTFFFFFNDTATTEIYTLSLHDALPICWYTVCPPGHPAQRPREGMVRIGFLMGRSFTEDRHQADIDRKSTRLNSSHSQISYAVFCLKKKNYRRSSRPPQRPTRPRTCGFH